MCVGIPFTLPSTSASPPCPPPPPINTPVPWPDWHCPHTHLDPGAVRDGGPAVGAVGQCHLPHSPHSHTSHASNLHSRSVRDGGFSVGSIGQCDLPHSPLVAGEPRVALPIVEAAAGGSAGSENKASISLSKARNPNIWKCPFPLSPSWREITCVIPAAPFSPPPSLPSHPPHTHSPMRHAA